MKVIELKDVKKSYGKNEILHGISLDIEEGSIHGLVGRNGCGKTTLIKEFLKKKTAFYFLATEELESQSMKRLAGVVARMTKNSLLQKAVFTDWLDLFQVIADYEPDKKKVLVIDEFPYLVKTNPAFPSILQNAWFSMGKFDAGKTIDYKIHDKNMGVYIFIIEGKIEVAEEILSKRDGIGIWDVSDLKINIIEHSDLLLIEVPMIS